MNIAVNTRLLLSNRLEGLGRFSYETLKRITQNHPEHHFIFIFDRPYSEEFIFSDNITPVVVYPPARHPILWYLFFDWGIPQKLKKYKVDLFFSPDGWLSLRTTIPQLPVIHDLNFFHNPEWVDAVSRKYYTYFFPRFIKKAKRIATVSEFTKLDIIKRYSVSPELIDVVGNGCTDGFRPLSAAEKKKVQDAYAMGEEFFLFLGLVHPRKNLARVMKAYSQFKKSTNSPMKLLVIGSIKYMTNDVRKVFESSTIKNDIVFTGRMSDSELKRIMASAQALLYTSLFEGFGIPIIEAMHCDVPVITSSTSSMPEVGGDAALYTDPYSVDSIADAMLKINTDLAFRAALIEKAKKQRLNFSWDKTAELMWNSIEFALKI
jgi:glycosyltransferase involved in cell wall biosynthesis